jgi:hypothetical protein
MPKVRQSKSDLEAHLKEQLDFLHASCAAYDAGNSSEAKRLAATVRLLVHDTDKSTSLLGQLGLKDLAFVDGGDTPSPTNILTTAGLTGMQISAAGSVHVPNSR